MGAGAGVGAGVGLLAIPKENLGALDSDAGGVAVGVGPKRGFPVAGLVWGVRAGFAKKFGVGVLVVAEPV